jgi:signal transduction histidine kinase
MTIKAKLVISMLIQVILVVIVGTVLLAAWGAINRANDKNVRSGALSEAMSEMRFITMENLLNHNERSLEQWELKYQTLTHMLAPTPNDSPAERQMLATMTDQHRGVRSLFDRLTASYQEPAPGQKVLVLNSIQERLAAQLLVKQQAQIAEVSKLAALSRTEITSQQRYFSWTVFGVIMLMFLVTIVNAAIVITTIASSLRSLERGAAAFAAGNLDYRISKMRKDEFGRLATAFNSMAISLKQIDQVKTEFILMVSHQLRTPATAVKGFSAMLLDGYMGKLSKAQRQTLEFAFVENERQLHLIDEILAVAQTETGEMTLAKSPTDLVQMVDEIVAAQASVLKERRQTVLVIRPKALPKLSVDAEKIRIVIENFLSNASNYSAEQKRIEIGFKQTAAEVVIEVRDNGFGIPKKDMGKLFKKFSRLSNTGSTRIEGAGLGLYLAQKIMALHNGRISVSSEAGQGSVFAIHLPAAGNE